MHTLGIYSDREIENNHSDFSKSNFLEARRRSWLALETIWDRLRPGQSEIEVGAAAQSLLKQMGSPRSWHKVNIRFGANTCHSFSHPLDSTSILTAGLPVLIDLGPTWKMENSELEYEGDVGDTRVFQSGQKSNPAAQNLCDTARRLFLATREQWLSHQLSGAALYRWLEKAATEAGYQLVEAADGHRLGDFPHHRFYKGSLAAVEFMPSPDVWMLEVHLKNTTSDLGAFYEDALIPQ